MVERRVFFDEFDVAVIESGVDGKLESVRKGGKDQKSRERSILINVPTSGTINEHSYHLTRHCLSLQGFPNFTGSQYHWVDKKDMSNQKDGGGNNDFKMERMVNWRTTGGYRLCGRERFMIWSFSYMLPRCTLLHSMEWYVVYGTTETPMGAMILAARITATYARSMYNSV